jgi:hypothetical protein
MRKRFLVKIDENIRKKSAIVNVLRLFISPGDVKKISITCHAKELSGNPRGELSLLVGIKFLYLPK